SAAAVERFAALHPRRPIVVAMSGTDLYDDLAHSEEALRSLALATRIVVLQRLGIEALPAEARARARTIVQSASAAPRRDREADAGTGEFAACVLAHLREVKDPLLAATAARLLPTDSRLRILHAGAALTPGLAEAARAEVRDNPRYRWLGELRRQESL